MEIKLRGGTVKIIEWTNPGEFVGTWTDRRGNTSAAYAWTKGAGYFLYTIEAGHIFKVGTIKRDLVDTAQSSMV